ncbi:GFA family protein [Pseudoxanthomonas sp.]|uniref:GFA family protein n=1 Tax=Pseudoxanthomonas sp. TaxID=1871049 RepID=UPI00261CF180|nr:GFA family protein [Pseudoxanthomonas sp.]WDS36007.1 MAG: GFA family protein [Pseudoxanthomonas sp.]
MSHVASCHCGALAFTFEGEIDQALDCNCSLCRRRGVLLWFTPKSAVRFQVDPAALRTYTFNTHRLQHHFCGICGVAPFSEGIAPDGTETVAVNLRCVPALDLAALKVVAHDGASR